MIEITKLTLNQLPLNIVELTEQNAALNRSNSGYKAIGIVLLVFVFLGYVQSQIKVSQPITKDESA